MFNMKMMRIIKWKKMSKGLQMISLTGHKNYLLKQKMLGDDEHISGIRDVQTLLHKVEHFLLGIPKLFEKVSLIN